MSTPILTTKLYMPPPRPNAIYRERLIQQLENAMRGKLTLLSAPAGFGKTTLVSDWVAKNNILTSWLSLDEADNDPTRFVTYLISSLQTIRADIGEQALGILQAPQPTPLENTLTILLNDIHSLPDDFCLVLDDYHLIENPAIDEGIGFVLRHLPPQMHLIIVTREDPNLPLARLRARGEMTELRVTDLRFTLAESVDFFNQTMGLSLSHDDVDALETRTEGWIAGLQLAAISLQGHRQDTAEFIESFTGSHHFVMDYLLEEVLNQQPAHVQEFLLCTAILERLNGSLCDALIQDETLVGQEILQYLEQANLFIIPLDNERRWYRYHHLFADLLHQRLTQKIADQTIQTTLHDLHLRASAWYAKTGLELEAFRHATIAPDIERAADLIEAGGMPLHFRGGEIPVLNWLKTLPPSVLNEMPLLWTTYASVLLVTGQVTLAEQAMESAEAILAKQTIEDAMSRDILGRIAATRATMAAAYKRIDEMITFSQEALEYLHPDNIAFRTSTAWKLAYAYHLQGKRHAAGEAYAEVIAKGRASGNHIFTITALLGLSGLNMNDNRLHQAHKTYQEVLEMLGERPLPIAGECHLGLAKLYYEWNDLEAVQHHLEESVKFTTLEENTDRQVAVETMNAQIKLAHGDLANANIHLNNAEQRIKEQPVTEHIPTIIKTRVRILLAQQKFDEAQALVENHDLPLSHVSVLIALHAFEEAHQVLDAYHEKMETRDWKDQLLHIQVLRAMAYYADNRLEEALRALEEVLAITEPESFARLFIDMGPQMADLLEDARQRNIRTSYVTYILTEFENANHHSTYRVANQALIEPLSERELEVLDLIAQGLSNREICDRLFLALSTVKGHNRRIFDKLQVQRRTEAVAKARELGLIL